MKLRRKRVTKQYNYLQKSGKRGLKRHPYIIPVMGLVGSVLVVCVLMILSNGQTVAPSDTKIVNVFVDGQQQTVATRASNVGDLIKNMNLNLIPEDLVEPKVQTPILEDNLNVNIYRARPVTIVDNSKTLATTLSAYTSPRLAAQQAGVRVYAEDDVKFEAGNIEKGIIGQEVVINRAYPVTINLYGTPVDFRTRATTVNELMKEKNITLQPGDTIIPSGSAKVTPGLSVIIASAGQKIITQEEDIPMPIITINDPGLPAGKTQIRSPGQPGKKVVTYSIQTVNGKETGRTVLQEIVATDPVRQIVAKGTLVVTPQYAGNKTGLMAAAGIPASQYGDVDYIISHESNWRLNAYNGSGCAGLGQACPGGKLAAACPSWQTDGVCQLRYFTNYAAKYGGWPGAYTFWLYNRWW